MLYTVIREAGERWDRSRGLREQELWDEHAAYMDASEAEGFILLAGPVGDGAGLHRVLQVVDAEGEQAVHARLAGDPWTPHMLRTVRVEPWTVLVGAPRLTPLRTAPRSPRRTSPRRSAA